MTLYAENEYVTKITNAPAKQGIKECKRVGKCMVGMIYL